MIGTAGSCENLWVCNARWRQVECEFRNIITRTRESTKNIIDVTSVHQRPDALILGQHLFFYVTDKQTSITRSHPRTHSHTTGLNVVLTVEREVVHC